VSSEWGRGLVGNDRNQNGRMTDEGRVGKWQGRNQNDEGGWRVARRERRANARMAKVTGRANCVAGVGVRASREANMTCALRDFARFFTAIFFAGTHSCSSV
jgi:hypothetical protein